MFLYICAQYEESLEWFSFPKGLPGTYVLARRTVLEAWGDVVTAGVREKGRRDGSLNQNCEGERDELVGDVEMMILLRVWDS